MPTAPELNCLMLEIRSLVKITNKFFCDHIREKNNKPACLIANERLIGV